MVCSFKYTYSLNHLGQSTRSGFNSIKMRSRHLDLHVCLLTFFSPATGIIPGGDSALNQQALQFARTHAELGLVISNRCNW